MGLGLTLLPACVMSAKLGMVGLFYFTLWWVWKGKGSGVGVSMGMSVFPSPDAYPGLLWHRIVHLALLSCGTSGGLLSLTGGEGADLTVDQLYTHQ